MSQYSKHLASSGSHPRIIDIYLYPRRKNRLRPPKYHSKYFQINICRNSMTVVIRVTFKEWGRFIKFLKITKTRPNLPYAGFHFYEKGKIKGHISHLLFWTAESEKGWFNEKGNFQPSEDYKKVNKTFLADQIHLSKNYETDIFLSRELFIEMRRCCFRAAEKLKKFGNSKSARG